MAKLGISQPVHSAGSVLSLGCAIPGAELVKATNFASCFPTRVQANLSTRPFFKASPRTGSRNQLYWSAIQARRAKVPVHITCEAAEYDESKTPEGPMRARGSTPNERLNVREVAPEWTSPTTSPCAPHYAAEQGSAPWISRLWTLVVQQLGWEEPVRYGDAQQHVAISSLPRRDAKTLRQFVRLLGLAVAAAAIGLFGRVSYKVPFSAPAHAATAEIVLKRAPGKVTTQKPTFNQRAVYALDYFFATEPAGKAVILLAITAIMTAFGGALYYRVAVAEDPDFNLPESVWTAWTFVADPGTHAGENTFRRRLVAVPLTMGGMLFFALLVGLMSDAVSSKVDQLQKGGSPVIEENHTLIVGWTPKTIPLVKELTEANKSRGPKRSIVVLGGLEKETMDEELLQALPVAERHGSKVVTRKGRPTATEDLKLCSAAMARSIIVLSPRGLLPHDADAQVLQTCLVLAYLSDIQGDVVAELAQLDSVKLAEEMLSTAITCTADRDKVRKPKLLAASSTAAAPAAADRIERFRKVVPVATDDIVLRMMVERALQPGTAAVAKELLLFEGSEFRFKAWPELVGKKFGEVMYVFEDAIPCGLRKKAAGGERSNYTLVNPPPDTIIEEGDRILVIAEDDDSYRPDRSHKPSHNGSFKAYQKQNKPVLKILVTGFRHDLKDVLRHVDSSVAKGSEVTLLATEDMEARNKELKQGSALQNVKLIHKIGDPNSRHVLEELPLETYDKTIILNNNNEDSGSSTTGTALLVRHIQVQRGRKDNVIVAELAAAHDDALQRVQETWRIDSVVPEELQAMVLAHLAEDADVGAVLDEVVSDAGSNMLLHEIGTYADYGDTLDFWDLQARALQNGEIVIAHKCAANGGEWELNPSNKSEKLVWNQGDEVLVLTRPA